jgi:hypothetical protein
MATPNNAEPFRSNTTNADLLNAIRRNASPEYQSRIPEATQGNVQDTISNLNKFRAMKNEFVDALVNRIGLEIYKYNTFTNPYAKFKQGTLEFGDTIEEVIVGLVNARTYDPDRDYMEADLFGQHRPEVQSRFHKINRQDYYAVTVNETMLQRAFLSPTGLAGFVGQLMAAPSTSDQWDEFLLMSQLLPEFYKAGGFFNVQVGDLSNVASDESDAKYALRQLRTLADTLPYISRHYNSAGMPVAAPRDSLELIVAASANAAIDVEALAGAFNIDKADFESRKTVIPDEHMQIPGAQAILTTNEFFVTADTLIDTTSQWNPVARTNNYFLHHHEVLSVSPFVPAILLTTAASTPIVIEDYVVTSIDAVTVTDTQTENVVTSVERGGLYSLTNNVTTTPAGGDNTAVRYVLSAGSGNLNTRVTRTGVLAVAADESATQLVITAIAVDSPDSTNPVQSVLTIPVVGDELILWPNPSVLSDANDNGLFEVTPAPIVKDGTNNVTIPTVKGVQYQEDGVNVTNGQVIAITGTHAFTAVARAGYELAAGAPASWSIS